MTVIEEVAAERQSQAAKGYTADHDDAHDGGEIAMAAAYYASPNLIYVEDRFAGGVQFIDPWPWEMVSDARGVEDGPHAGANYPPPPSAYPPHHRRRLLIKSAALIVAEIERLDRQAATEKRQGLGG